MKILAIETSCDDTCAAVLENDRVLSNVVSSQVDLHQAWGGVVPDIAKRAHQVRIRPVVETALKRARMKIKDIEIIAVTKGPGLAIALGVGVNTAKELAIKYNKKRALLIFLIYFFSFLPNKIFIRLVLFGHKFKKYNYENE